MLLSPMTFKLLKHSLLLSLALITITGCTLIRMGKESAEKVKTTSTSGYQNGIKPDEIRNVKDYIVNENDFVIIAENPHKTVYKTRNNSNMGRLSKLDDLMDYCIDIEGKIEFGKQFGASISREYSSMDFEFSSIKSDYKKYKVRGYEGWMKCVDSEDNFEVLRKERSKYFTIFHEKEQLQGYALQWYIDYFDIEDVDIRSLNVGHWSYMSLVQFGGICEYHKGKTYLSNRYTQKKRISLNEYLIQQLNPLTDNKPFLMASGSFECEQSSEGKTDFALDLSYSKKYRKILYTKRQ